ncbi:MAG: magnesium/cobalt transporter CorA [Calditrichia bacterium]
MKRNFKFHSRKLGLPPGAMVHIGEKKTDKVEITLMDYDSQKYDYRPVEHIEEAFPFKETPTVTWLNIYGLHEVELINRIGREYNIHPLVLEDILNTGQQPKVEFFEDYIFLILKMIWYDSATREISIEQISIVMGSNYVLTFQERRGDIFNPLRQRIESGRGRARVSGPDYLFYAIMDVVVDNYFLVMENLSEEIEILDKNVLLSPEPAMAKEIQRLRKELLFLGRAIWPLKEVVVTLRREGIDQIKAKTIPFLRDLLDHVNQVSDTLEIYRHMVSSILDIYLSTINTRMNEVMKVLTIIATIFIPLSFIAGIYGMNFEYMPELHFRWAYPTLLLFMFFVLITMLLFFRRKGWL